MDRGRLTEGSGQEERRQAREAYEQLRVEHEANLLALSELRERGTSDGLLENLEARLCWNAAALNELARTPLLG